nr:hypothetical protein [Candidatus Desulfofervidus auxilii]
MERQRNSGQVERIVSNPIVITKPKNSSETIPQMELQALLVLRGVQDAQA